MYPWIIAPGQLPPRIIASEEKKEYKKVKLMAINFRCRTNIKYFMQTQVLPFCKDTAKVSSLPLLKITTKLTRFLPAKKKI